MVGKCGKEEKDPAGILPISHCFLIASDGPAW